MADPFLVQAIESGGSTPLNAEAAAIWEQALAKARGQLANLLNYPNRDTLFADVFGRAGTDSATFAANLQVLLAALGGEGLRIAVDLRSDDELAGAFAAYAASGHTGLERIYVNADKLNNGLLDVNLATSALLEEFGHALDWRLNGGADSPGDEGQLFATEVSGVVLTAEQRAVIDAEDDTAVLTIEGVQVWVEQAAIVISSNMNWSAITGGSGTNGAPTTADTITINAGVTLTVDVLSAVSGALTNNGTLAVGNGNAVFLGSLAAAGGVSLGNASSALTVGTASTSTTYSGVISGAGTVRKTGTGIWTVSGASTYTGATTVSAGTLKLGAAGDGTNSPLGTVAGSTSFTSGWVLDLNGYSLGTAEPLTIRGTGIAGGGALTNSHWTTATYSGLLTLGAASTVKASSGDIILSNTGTITGSGFTLTLDGSATSSSMASALATGTGGLTKAGTGTWTVSGASSYTGATTISGGTLKLGAAGDGTNSPLGTVGGITSVASGAALDLNGVTLGTAESLTIRGTGVSSGGALTNSSGTDVTYSGLLTLGAPSTVKASSGNISLSNTGTITGSGFTLTLDGSATGSSMASALATGTGGLRKFGTGTWTVSGASSYTGATTISGGTLKLGAAGDGTNSPLGTVGGITSVASGAALDLNGVTLGTAESLTIRGTGVSSGGALTNSSGTDVTYSGLLTLGAPSTVKASSGNISLSNTGTITGSGFTLTLDGSATGSSMASALATGTGGLTKFGTGTWTVSGASSYSGVTTVSSGTLDVSGAAGALTATSAVEIYGGTLLLSGSAADRISNSASIYLDGDTDSQLQLSGAITETLGSLTLAGAGARVIDFGSGSGVLTLASLTAASPLSLQIWNWSGTTGSGGGTDQLIISSGSLGGSLSTTDISFYSDSGTTLLSSAAVIDADSDELVPVVCFLAGTLIATPTGEQPIETLQPGDLINTAEGPRPVRFLARSTRSIDQLEDLGKMPIRINQAALGALGPAQDTFLSPSHAVHYAGSLVEAAALINGTSIQQLYDWPEASLTYYNIELERHGLITANGLLVESYFGNYRNNGFSRDCWDNYHDFVARYGAGESMVELPLPRIPFARQIPMELRLSLQLHQDQYKAANPAIAASAVGQFAGLCL